MTVAIWDNTLTILVTLWHMIPSQINTEHMQFSEISSPRIQEESTKQHERNQYHGSEAQSKGNIASAGRYHVTWTVSEQKNTSTNHKHTSYVTLSLSYWYKETWEHHNYASKSWQQIVTSSNGCNRILESEMSSSGVASE